MFLEINRRTEGKKRTEIMISFDKISREYQIKQLVYKF